MKFSTKMRVLPLVGLAGVLLFLSGDVAAQFRKLPKIPKKVMEKIPSVSDLTGPKPALSTGLKDVTREAPFLDDFNPTQFAPMTKLKRAPNGGFLIRPGLYELNAQSYCLRAGTHEPREGRGYVYAPLAGSRAKAVGGILRRSVQHTDIPQRTIQYLLWAILSRAKFDDLKPELKAAAVRLLKPKEISQLRTGGVEKYSDKALQKAIRKAPRQVRVVLRAEADLRRMATDVNATYEQAERVAVLAGVPPRDKKGREILYGRWSWHPQGFFVRYFPSGYSRTRVQVYLPAPFTIKRDAKGRIASIAWTDGYRIETDYNDDIEPLRIPGEKKLRGYAFRSIRYIRPHPRRRGKTETVEIKNRGWTFVGPLSGKKGKKGKKRKKRSAWFRSPAPAGLASGFLSQRQRILDFEQWQRHQQRYEQAQEAKGWVDKVSDWGERLFGDPGEDSIDNIGDMDHYQDGLEAATSGDPSERYEWIADTHTRFADALRYATCVIGEECEPPRDGYNPADVAVPGNSGSQRLGVSGRSY